MGFPVAAAFGLAAASAGMQQGGGAINSALQHQSNKSLMEHQRHLNSYTWLMEDLKNAGLSPMLAFGQGQGPGNSASLGSTGLQSAPNVDIAGTAKAFQEAKTESKRKELVVQQTFESVAKEMQAMSAAGKLDAEADLAWRKARVEHKNWQKIGQEITNLKQQLKNLKAQESATQADVFRIQQAEKELIERQRNWKAQTAKVATELVKITRMKEIRENTKLLYYIETTLESLRMHSAAIFAPGKE